MIDKKILKSLSSKNCLDNSLPRRKIWKISQNPVNFTTLKKILNISSPTLQHHLKILERNDLISRKKVIKGNKAKKGNEVVIKSKDNKKDIIEAWDYIEKSIIKIIKLSPHPLSISEIWWRVNDKLDLDDYEELDEESKENIEYNIRDMLLNNMIDGVKLVVVADKDAIADLD